MQTPNQQDMERARRILRYLRGTSDFQLQLGTSKKLESDCYVDADYANAASRKSITGYATRLGGTTISWLSKSQDTVALSTTEAEYMAASKAAQQMLWERSILKELGVIHESPSTLHEDNSSAISLIKHPKAHTRTKHIDVRHHFIRETITNGLIQVIHCPTSEMRADMFTKALRAEVFQEHRHALGLIPSHSSHHDSGTPSGGNVEIPSGRPEGRPDGRGRLQGMLSGSTGSMSPGRGPGPKHETYEA